MRIAFVLRSDYKAKPGGDVVQALNTAEELRLLGYDITIITEFSEDVGYDIYHLFNLTRVYDAYKWSNYLTKQDKTFVLSTIWHSLRQMEVFYGCGSKLFPISLYLGLKDAYIARDLSLIERLKLMLFWKKIVRKVVGEAKALLPNSQQEVEALYREIKVNQKGLHFVIPNAVSLNEKFDNSNKQKVIICAGRIEPRKNQIRILQAFTKLRENPQFADYKIEFIGALNELHPLYIKKFFAQLQLTKNAEYLGKVDYSEVQRAFANSKVSILASHFETTGLVSLEAQYQGCNVVMTDSSYNDYYFGDTVTYCNPRDVDSIYQALSQACAIESVVDRGDDFEEFSWQNVAHKTSNAYKSINPEPGQV